MSLTRILVTWLVLSVVMTANGIFRELLLERWMPEEAAGWVSLALGVALLLIGTRIGFRGIPADYPAASLLLVGAFLIVLTIGFEFARDARRQEVIRRARASVRVLARRAVAVCVAAAGTHAVAMADEGRSPVAGSVHNEGAPDMPGRPLSTSHRSPAVVTRTRSSP